MLNTQRNPCFALTILSSFLQLLADLALKSRIFLCPCWFSGVGDLDLFPVHCASPEAPCVQRMHRNHLVLSWDRGPSCSGRKHQPALHRLSGETYNPSRPSRGSVLAEDAVFYTGSHPLPVRNSLVLWSHGSVANRAHKLAVQLSLWDSRHSFRGVSSGALLLSTP